MDHSTPGPHHPGPEQPEPADAAPPDPAAGDPAAPAPLGVERAPTGDPGVDLLLERLADADHLPADGHLAVYEDVHGGLRSALAALDTRPGPAPAPPAVPRTPPPSPPYDHRS
ncbi:hypothetical protein [Streptomyces sp. CAU 1734]|uniref:hypothetical protein n=1 Tax=Streptomyces sp. CAU 1734 TaxID=3140360 RepID=UPI00326156B7